MRRVDPPRKRIVLPVGRRHDAANRPVDVDDLRDRAAARRYGIHVGVRVVVIRLGHPVRHEDDLAPIPAPRDPVFVELAGRDLLRGHRALAGCGGIHAPDMVVPRRIEPPPVVAAILGPRDHVHVAQQLLRRGVTQGGRGIVRQCRARERDRVPVGRPHGRTRTLGHVGQLPRLSAREREKIDLRRGGVVHRTGERQRLPVRRPSRRSIARAAGQPLRHRARPSLHHPHRGLVPVVFLVDAHEGVRDERPARRYLRISHPMEREQIALRDRPALRPGGGGRHSAGQHGRGEQYCVKGQTSRHTLPGCGVTIAAEVRLR